MLIQFFRKRTFYAISYSTTAILDIDECTEYNETLCANNGTCENVNGSYVCLCSSTGFGGVNCEAGKDMFGLIR